MISQERAHLCPSDREIPKRTVTNFKSSTSHENGCVVNEAEGVSRYYFFSNGDAESRPAQCLGPSHNTFNRSLSTELPLASHSGGSWPSSFAGSPSFRKKRNKMFLNGLCIYPGERPKERENTKKRRSTNQGGKSLTFIADKRQTSIEFGCRLDTSYAFQLQSEEPSKLTKKDCQGVRPPMLTFHYTNFDRLTLKPVKVSLKSGRTQLERSRVVKDTNRRGKNTKTVEAAEVLLRLKSRVLNFE